MAHYYFPGGDMSGAYGNTYSASSGNATLPRLTNYMYTTRRSNGSSRHALATANKTMRWSKPPSSVNPWRFLFEKIDFLVGPSFPPRLTSKDAFIPRICPSEGQTVIHLRPSHDENLKQTIGVWRGLTMAQADELAFWEDSFKKCLEQIISRQITNIQCSRAPLYHFDAQIGEGGPSVKGLMLNVDIDEVVMLMKSDHLIHGRHYEWLAADGMSDEALLLFMRTRNCLVLRDANSFGSPTTLISRRLAVFVQSPFTSLLPLVGSSLLVFWAPPKIRVKLTPHILKEGDDVAMSLSIVHQFKTGNMGAQIGPETLFTCTAPWLSWDRTTATFKGKVPHFSIVDQSLLSEENINGTINQQGHAGSYKLKLNIVAIITEMFPSGVRWEQTVSMQHVVEVRRLWLIPTQPSVERVPIAIGKTEATRKASQSEICLSNKRRCTALNPAARHYTPSHFKAMSLEKASTIASNSSSKTVAPTEKISSVDTTVTEYGSSLPPKNIPRIVPRVTDLVVPTIKCPVPRIHSISATKAAADNKKPPSPPTSDVEMSDCPSSLSGHANFGSSEGSTEVGKARNLRDSSSETDKAPPYPRVTRQKQKQRRVDSGYDSWLSDPMSGVVYSGAQTPQKWNITFGDTYTFGEASGNSFDGKDIENQESRKSESLASPLTPALSPNSSLPPPAIADSPMPGHGWTVANDHDRDHTNLWDRFHGLLERDLFDRDILNELTKVKCLLASALARTEGCKNSGELAKFKKDYFIQLDDAVNRATEKQRSMVFGEVGMSATSSSSSSEMDGDVMQAMEAASL